MFKQLWRLGGWYRFFADVLLALSIIVSIYLLWVAYRKLLGYFKFGKKVKTTVPYVHILDLPNHTISQDAEILIEADDELEAKCLLGINGVENVLFDGQLKKGVNAISLDIENLSNGRCIFQIKTPHQFIEKILYIDR